MYLLVYVGLPFDGLPFDYFCGLLLTVYGGVVVLFGILQLRCNGVGFAFRGVLVTFVFCFLFSVLFMFSVLFVSFLSLFGFCVVVALITT